MIFNSEHLYGLIFALISQKTSFSLLFAVCETIFPQTLFFGIDKISGTKVSDERL
jgi:hypothetical protein